MVQVSERAAPSLPCRNEVGFRRAVVIPNRATLLLKPLPPSRRKLHLFAGLDQFAHRVAAHGRQLLQDKINDGSRQVEALDAMVANLEAEQVWDTLLFLGNQDDGAAEGPGHE